MEVNALSIKPLKWQGARGELKRNPRCARQLTNHLQICELGQRDVLGQSCQGVLFHFTTQSHSQVRTRRHSSSTESKKPPPYRLLRFCSTDRSIGSTCINVLRRLRSVIPIGIPLSTFSLESCSPMLQFAIHTEVTCCECVSISG
jgi:hypothetical protein